jgi:hypothetical protein
MNTLVYPEQADLDAITLKARAMRAEMIQRWCRAAYDWLGRKTVTATQPA